MRVFQKTFKSDMTFCQETKDFIFQNEKKDDRRFKKKEVTVLPCGSVEAG